jgi:drug/metabolite transporter (DMT)-like permease
VRLVSATTDEGARLWGAAPTAYLLLLVAMLSWSANMVIGRGLVGVVGPFTLSWTRWTIAFLLVLPFAGRELWARRAVLRREWKLFLVLGVVGFAGSNTFCYLALQSTSAVNASLINSAGPLMIFAASLVVLGERFGARQFWGLGLALAGVVAIVLRGDPRTLFALEINRGDLFMLMGVAAWCVYSIRLRERPPELSPVALVAALFGLGMLALTPLAAWEAKLEPSPGALAAILYVGIFPSIVSILCWNRAVALIGAARSSVFTYLMPLIAALLAMLFLGERIEPFHLLGGGLIFAGLALGLVRR